ncbi:gamma-glutamylcyclotransferase family protein [Thioalkalicoccus limnaeus]|uniref:Gamma-glutamylcyclotransferase family protein n=1 Tax=Thioalkalicoccus limnaeus TaxID=120681 RepID=A0ABV4BDZ7_9GAMM
MEHRVFVYGTLRRGQVNHRRLSGHPLLGEHRTDPCFSLYDLGAYPGLVRGGATPVCGEIYLVNARTLRYLDRLEDYPRLYSRILIPSPWGQSWVYCYRGMVRHRPLIPSGDWLEWADAPGSFRSAAIRRARDPKTQVPWSDRAAPVVRG